MKPTQTLAVDRDAREVFNRAAIAASMADTDEALEVCRMLGRIEADYELRLRSGARAQRETGATFAGKPMASRFPGSCAVCGASFPVGADILYAPDLKRAAHLGCGEPMVTEGR